MNKSLSKTSRSTDRAFVGRYTRYPDSTGKRVAEGGKRLRGHLAQSRTDEPLVTIITVCWNSVRTIEQTIRSVLEQTYRNIEYLVIDGASTDGTLDILRKYDTEIDYYVSEPDEGLYFAMNKGLELAQGDYILLLNSDDWYEPVAVEKLASAIEYSGCDITGALARYVNPNGTSQVLRAMPFDHSVLLRMPLRHETMLIPAALYDKMGPYNTEFTIIADYEYTVRLFESGASYYEIREPLLNFRTEGVSNTAKDRLDAEMRNLISRNFPFLGETDLLLLTDHANISPQTFIDIANDNPQEYEFRRAVRCLLKDRKIHSGPRWQEFQLEMLVSDTSLVYPKVSVIIPFFNSEGSMTSVLDNVLSQDLDEIEVICVDDCSSDGSRAIVETYMAKDGRVRLLRNPINMGPGSSRNRGIRAARGQYVFFLDADDAITPGGLRKLHDMASRHGSVIVRGAFIAGQKVHGQSGSDVVKYAAGVSDKPLVNTTLKRTPQLLNTTEGHCAALYDTDFAEAILYPEDIRVGEDSLFLVRAYAAASAITVLPEAVYRYQLNPNSSMNTMTSEKYFDGLTWRRRAWHVLRDSGVAEIGEALLFNFWSEPYFDGLEKTLTDVEKQRYFQELHAAFAAAGWNRAESTRNISLRNRINAMISRYGETVAPANTSPQRSAALHVATFTTQDHGGAGLGTQRRVEALRRGGVDAHIYCAFQDTKHDYVHRLPYAKPLATSAVRDIAWKAWHKASVLTRDECPHLKARELFSKVGSIVDFRDIKSVFDSSDIVHLHWVSGIFDYDHSELLADKPVAWTLADMNAFTGGCHYSEGCEGYKMECRDCPLLGNSSDLAHQAWQKKRAAYARIKNLHIICPSQWLADCARASSLFGDRPVHVIPNALPVDRFKPTNKLVARLRLGLPLDKKLVVFGAHSLSNRRKGGDILVQSIRHLRDMGKAEGVEGLFFGSSSLDIGVKGHNMGHVSDEAKLSLIYSAADVYAFPSREDNAPLTVAESLLSGTPIVAFPVGNVPELIRHKDTGFIARYEDARDFAEGLVWALAGHRSREATSRGLRCCVTARAHNDPSIAVARHIHLYEMMLKANNS